MTLAKNRDVSRGLPLGKNGGWGLALNGAKTLAYASNYRDGTVHVIDVAALKVVNTIQLNDPNG